MAKRSHEWKPKGNYKSLIKKPANKFVQLLRARHEHDLQHAHERGFRYNHARAERVVTFFRTYLKHSKGRWAGKPFELSDWQEWDILRILFGWEDEQGHRRFTEGHIEVSKKQGKSTMGAGCGVYLLAADGEPGAECYSAATVKKQASIIHSEAVNMVKASKDLSRFIDIFKNSLSVPRTNSKYLPISADADFTDGVNPHGVLADELHLWKGRGLYDVLRDSMRTRTQPMFLSFTTAGSSRTGICWTNRQYAEKILDGFNKKNGAKDDRFFPYIATLDAEDDPFDPKVWIKSNPNLGVSVTLEGLQESANKVKNNPALLNSYLRYLMNRWTAQDKRWFTMDKWEACAGTVDAEELKGRACYGGLDLSSTQDLTAFVLAFNINDRIAWLPFYFVPEEKIEEKWRTDRVPFPEWVKSGFIEVTPGSVIDNEYIRARIIKLSQVYDIKEVNFDPWNGTESAAKLNDAGVKMVEMRQGYATMNPACKYFESALYSRRLLHGDNPATNWMAENIQVAMDPAGNIKPDKGASEQRIDGIVAGIMATWGLALAADETSYYEQNELVFL